MLTDEEVKSKIIENVKSLSWGSIARLGINAQQAQKIKRGESVKLTRKTVDRLREIMGERP
jgi:hypothetical protein